MHRDENSYETEFEAKYAICYEVKDDCLTSYDGKEEIKLPSHPSLVAKREADQAKRSDFIREIKVKPHQPPEPYHIVAYYYDGEHRLLSIVNSVADTAFADSIIVTNRSR